MHQFAISLILTLTESMAQQNYSGGSTVIREVVSYVTTNYKEDITLAKLAEHVRVNSTYLSTLFKQEMGIPFTAYLNNIRLARSEELLRTSHQSITEICLLVGFSSPSYLRKFSRSTMVSVRRNTESNINSLQKQSLACAFASVV